MLTALLLAAAVGYVHPEQLVDTAWVAIHSKDANVRVLDVRDPFSPKEVAFYIPAMNANTVVLQTPVGQAVKLPYTEAADRRAIQTNNAEVDERGYIYIVDRANTGMHILELTGPARAIANWKAAATE